MRNVLKKYGIYIAIAIFWGYTFYVIPLVHDSWAGQIYNNHSNILNWIKSVSQLYYSVNGRIISFIIVGFFERNEVMLDLANTVFMTALIWLMSKTLNCKKSLNASVLIWALLLLASVNIRTEVYFYATMIYVIPLVLFFLFIRYVQCYRNISGISNKTKFAILCIIGILNAGWIEHSGFAFVFILGIYWLIDLVKNRKINIKFTIFELLNGITFVIMMLSPGLRLQRQISPEGALVDTVITNLGATVQAIIYDHKMIFLLLIFASMIVMFQRTEKKGIIFWLYQIVMSCIACVLMLNLASGYLGIQLYRIFMLNSTIQWTYGMLWSIVGVILIMLLFVPLLVISNKEEMVFAYWVGMFSLAPTIVTPNFGYRICFFAYVLIVYLTTGVISNIKLDSNVKKSFLIGLIGTILFVKVDEYMILLANINKIQDKRETLIELTKYEQMMGTWDYDKTLILPMFSADQLYLGASPQPFYDIVHHQVFLDFYDLDPETLVLFSNDSNELRVFVENQDIVFEMIPKNENTNYQYIYYIMCGGSPVWCSEATTDTTIEATLPDESGKYYFMCDIIGETGYISDVFSAKVCVVK